MSRYDRRSTAELLRRLFAPILVMPDLPADAGTADAPPPPPADHADPSTRSTNMP